MNRQSTSWVCGSIIVLAALAASCSAGSSSDSQWSHPSAGGAAGSGGTGNLTGTGGTGAGGGFSLEAGPETTTASNCAESSKVSYLVSRDNDLYSFNPDLDGLSSYAKIGHLACPSSSSPQAMAVARSGVAYVFFDSGEMFLVDTVTVACTPTSYKHPAEGSSFTLGLGFTSDSDGAQTEALFAASPDVGLYTIDPKDFGTSLLGVHEGVAADLTGGPDGKLFYFRASNKTLYEVDRNNGFAMSTVHEFKTITHEIQAWALTRYAGVFYMFTAGYLNTMTTRYDPAADEESTRDKDIGLRIVGAGQSTCVPPPPVK